MPINNSKFLLLLSLVLFNESSLASVTRQRQDTQILVKFKVNCSQALSSLGAVSRERREGSGFRVFEASLLGFQGLGFVQE